MIFNNHEENVKGWYSFLDAKWYDPFRKVWGLIVEKKAEKDMIKDLKKIADSKSKVLDIGCGSGINAVRILKNKIPLKSYIGIDFSEDMLAIAKNKITDKRFSFKKEDIYKYSPKTKFDIIISTWVLSHLDDQSATINKFYKALNKGGSMFLVFLTKPKWYINFWFYPWARLFATRYVPTTEIEKFPEKKTVNRYMTKITTLVIIKK